MFEEGAEELRKLIRAVKAFEIPTPVVIDVQIDNMHFICNTYKRIRGEMGVTARYPELLQQIQLLTPKIKTIMMHYLSSKSQAIGEFDDAASSDFTVNAQTLKAFKIAFGLPGKDNWKAFFDLLDKVTMLDDIEADRSKQFVDERSRPIFNEPMSIAGIWSSVVREDLKGRITKKTKLLME